MGGFILIAVVGLVITGVGEDSPDLDDWAVLRLGLRRVMILWEAKKALFEATMMSAERQC